MQENPSIYWEDAAERHRFDSLDEAMDVLHDPILQEFLSVDRCTSPFLKVREFRPFSSKMVDAWDVVERLGAEPFQLRKEGRDWMAAFGDRAVVKGTSAEMAICLAALRSIGCEVKVEFTKHKPR